MKINLNDEIWTGIDVQRTSKRGKVISREFQRMAITADKDNFLSFAQYILDSAPDTTRFVIIHQPTQAVISFAGLMQVIGMKSKRYTKGAQTHVY